MSGIRKVVCAMFGGVDSSVSAFLLKKMGFHVEGIFMKNWDESNETGFCSQDQDLEDARYVCRKLDIKLREVNFVKEYWNDVFSQLLAGYEQGLTPNPDVLCNRYVKFGHLYRYAVEEMGGDALATGHYCRNSNGQFLQHYIPGKAAHLLMGIDPVKDQSLFLAQISQHALQRSMFPVGGFMKSKVKVIAKEAGLDRISKKKESMGICFIGSRNFQSFIDEYIPPSPGPFVDVDTGKVVGEHRGIHCWTLGQRTHLAGFSAAYFVQSLDPNTQTVFVALGTRHPSLFCENLIAESPHWISPSLSAGLLHPDLPPLQCSFKYQHIHPMLPCTVYACVPGTKKHEDDDGRRGFVDCADSISQFIPGLSHAQKHNPTLEEYIQAVKESGYSDSYVERFKSAKKGTSYIPRDNANDMANDNSLQDEMVVTGSGRYQAHMTAQGYSDVTDTESSAHESSSYRRNASSNNREVNDETKQNSEPLKSCKQTSSSSSNNTPSNDTTIPPTNQKNSPLEEYEGKNFPVDIHFPHPLRALAPGQYAVLYSGAVCLGSARILRQGPTLHQKGHTEPIELVSTFT